MKFGGFWRPVSLPLVACLAVPCSVLVMSQAAAAQDSSAQDSGVTVVVKSPPPAAPAATRTTAAGVLPLRGPTGGSNSGQTNTAPTQLRPPQSVTTGSVSATAIPAPAVKSAPPAGDINNTTADQGAGWQAAVTQAQGPTPLLGAAREKAVQEINAYFNGMDSLQGTFTQVDSEQKVTTGKFYVERPGKLRFDYDPPSPLTIVSDGHFLAIEDSSLKTIERYPIESTPFRLLLAKNVDLERDARILGVAKGDDELSINLEDKKDDASGSIRLVFTTDPKLKLSQWIITDAQGLTTTVSLDNVEPGRKVAADFFQSRQSFNPYR